MSENLFAKIADWFVSEGEVIGEDVISVLGAVKSKATIIIGYAETIDMAVVAEANPLLAEGIKLGLEGLKNLIEDVSVAATAVGNTAPQVAAQLHALSTAADTLHLQASPFYQAIANDAGKIDKAIVASVVAMTGTASATA